MPLPPDGESLLLSFQLGEFYTWLKQDENWSSKLCVLAPDDFQRHQMNSFDVWLHVS